MQKIFDHVPPAHKQFMEDVNRHGHGRLSMRYDNETPDEASITLDVRMRHGDRPEHNPHYVIALTGKEVSPHHKTGEPVMQADECINFLGLPPDLPRDDMCYLGPFDRNVTLKILSVANNLASHLALADRVETLSGRARVHDIVRKAFAEKVQELCADKDIRQHTKSSDKTRSPFRVIDGGKKDGPNI